MRAAELIPVKFQAVFPCFPRVHSLTLSGRFPSPFNYFMMPRNQALCKKYNTIKHSHYSIMECCVDGVCKGFGSMIMRTVHTVISDYRIKLNSHVLKISTLHISGQISEMIALDMSLW